MKQRDERTIFSVGEVNALAKELLEQVTIWVEGEIFDYKSSSGRYYYIYFQLKDESGQMILPSIMLPQVFSSLNFDFDNGQKVLAHGKLTLFTKSGKFQFQADRLELAGEGQLARQLELLKAKLQAEGLLDQSRKRPLPELSQKIGVITSEASDAWVDFQRHSLTKVPFLELILADVFVQGPKAVNSIVRAIERMQTQDVELLVITRGGGSLEDLAAFNDERVARAIAASSIPTLVGVGHEKDITIADLVADVRASTPTNAGQMITLAYERAATQLQHHSDRLRLVADRLVSRQAESIDSSLRRLQQSQRRYEILPLQLTHVAGQLQKQFYALTTTQSSRLSSAKQSLLTQSTIWPQRLSDRLEADARQLASVSPLAILSRGYSLVEVNGRIIRSATEVKQGDTMQVRLYKGNIKGLVTRVEEE